MTRCRLCKSNNTELYYSNVIGLGIKKDFDILKCNKCMIYFTDSKMERDELERYYDRLETAFNGAGGKKLLDDYKSRKDHYWDSLGYKVRLKEIFSRKKDLTSLLDVGCGAGFFIDYVKSTGIMVYGVELSEWGYRSASTELKLKVLKKSLSDIETQEIPPVDVITMYDVLEHSPNPVAELANAYKLLKRGGLLIINLPNINSLISQLTRKYWNKLIPPNHLYHFDPRTLRNIVNNAEFEVLSISTNRGDSSEFAAESLGSLWRIVAKIFPNFERAYARRAEPLGANKSLNLFLVKASIKSFSHLTLVGSILSELSVKIERGEGVHLIARKP